MAPSKLQCTQCGGTDFDEEGAYRRRCAYCGSLFEIPHRATGPTVTIMKGANVVFGEHAKVQIRGGLAIEDGAHVDILGELTLLERADEERIDAAKMKLKEEGRT